MGDLFWGRPPFLFLAMKRILLLFLALSALVSCEQKEADQTEKDAYVLDQLKETSVSMLSETTYKLNASLSGRGYSVNLTIGSEGLELVPGDYDIKKDVAAVGDCTVTLNDGQNDLPLNSGKVSIRTTANGYSVDFSMSGHYDYKFRYEGSLTFSLDFEPSENTFFVMEGDVTTMNAQWQTVIVSGVRKYAVTVVSSEGKDLAYLEIVGQPGKTLEELVGTYDVKSSSTNAGTIIAGGVWWGSGSGSYFVNESGEAQYITSGKVTLSLLKGADGIEYYSFTGSGLSTTSLSGTSGSGDLRIKHVAEKRLLGTVERDHVIKSTYKGRDMKYSIYLPDSYDGVKEFPVLWLIHGYGDDQNSWLDKGYLHRFVHQYASEGGREMIIVTPDGLTDFYMGPYENYFFKELMPEVESKFKVKKGREYRTVAGLSMGGHGSLYYGLKYNDMFCYAYAMSPACMFNIQQVIAGKDKADLPGITIETGIQDQTTNLQSVENIHTTLLNEGVTHDYITRDGGHDWTFWQTSLPKVLKKSGEVFGE